MVGAAPLGAARTNASSRPARPPVRKMSITFSFICLDPLTSIHSPASHIRVIGPAASLRYDPIDVLPGVLDVAGLAVNAILRVDLQIWVARLCLPHDFVDAGGTITLFRRIVEPIVDRDRLRRIAQAQMRGLVLLMIGVRNEYRGEPVEADLTVRSGVVDTPRGARRGQLQVIGVVVERPRGGAPQDVGVERRISETGPQAPAETRPDIADAAQLLPHPALFEGASHRGAGISGEPPKYGLGSNHPGFHGGMIALDLGHVDETRGAADQRTSRKVEKRDRLKAALVECPRPIGDAPTVLKERADRRVCLEPLEFLERVQKRVLVVEADHKTDRHLAVLEMIDERAA